MFLWQLFRQIILKIGNHDKSKSLVSYSILLAFDLHTYLTTQKNVIAESVWTKQTRSLNWFIYAWNPKLKYTSVVTGNPLNITIGQVCNKFIFPLIRV